MPKLARTKKHPVAPALSLKRQRKAANFLKRTIPQEDLLSDTFESWDQESTTHAQDIYRTPDYVQQERRRRAEELEHRANVARAVEQTRAEFRARAAPVKRRTSRCSPNHQMHDPRRVFIRRLIAQGKKDIAYCRAMDEAGFKTPVSWGPLGCPSRYVDAFRHPNKKKWQAKIRDERYRAGRTQK